MYNSNGALALTGDVVDEASRHNHVLGTKDGVRRIQMTNQVDSCGYCCSVIDVINLPSFAKFLYSLITCGIRRPISIWLHGDHPLHIKGQSLHVNVELVGWTMEWNNVVVLLMKESMDLALVASVA